MLNDCLMLALQAQPSQNADQNTVALAFVQAQMAMVRCYRRMLYEQQAYIPWGEGPIQAFQYQQGNLFQIEIILANQQGPGGYAQPY
jgi:hypothetical protein